MILYLDTSSMLKLFVAEEASDEVAAWVEAATVLVASAVAHVEVHSAVARRQGDGSLTLANSEAVSRDFLRFWSDMAVLPVDERAASELALRHRLRALDAIHLAAALRSRGSQGRKVTVSSFDERLLAAARAEGFDLLTA